MANAFKNTGNPNVPITDTVVYTCPVNTTAVIHTLNLADTDPDFGVTATVTILDASVPESRILVSKLPLVPGGGYVFDKPINLEQNDQLIVKSNVVSRLSVSLGILEIS